MIGRAVAMLAGLAADVQPSGWRLVARPGLDQRRAQAHLAHDLDAVEEAFAGHRGLLKCQLTGPWTLAANVELPRGDRVLSDRGAVRDLTESLAEGLRAHVGELERRVPGSSVVVQVDEPSLPAVAQGRVPTQSGFGTLAAVGEVELLAGLRPFLDGRTGVHCCAPDVPLDLLERAGVAFVSLDPAYAGIERLGELAERGVQLFLGGRVPRELSELAARIVVTPACGLAGHSPDEARAELARVRELARRLAEGGA